MPDSISSSTGGGVGSTSSNGNLDKSQGSGVSNFHLPFYDRFKLLRLARHFRYSLVSLIALKLGLTAGGCTFGTFFSSQEREKSHRA